MITEANDVGLIILGLDSLVNSDPEVITPRSPPAFMNKCVSLLHSVDIDQLDVVLSFLSYYASEGKLSSATARKALYFAIHALEKPSLELCSALSSVDGLLDHSTCRSFETDVCEIKTLGYIHHEDCEVREQALLVSRNILRFHDKKGKFIDPSAYITLLYQDPDMLFRHLAEICRSSIAFDMVDVAYAFSLLPFIMSKLHLTRVSHNKANCVSSYLCVVNAMLCVKRDDDVKRPLLARDRCELLEALVLLLVDATESTGLPREYGRGHVYLPSVIEKIKTTLSDAASSADDATRRILEPALSRLKL